MVRQIALVLVVLFALSACGADPAASPGNEYGAAPAEDAAAVPAATEAPAATSAPAAELRKVTLALSFIPNVQFAPYYVAKAKGYYTEAGLDVEFDYNYENDVVQRAASWPQSEVEFATASGTSTLLARQQQIPAKTVMTLYQSFPVVFFSKADTPLDSAADLEGQTLGIPGRFGESYFALLAILYANDLQESDVTVQEIGFTQAAAVLEDKVAIATGYAMNEPVLLRSQGEEVNVLRVADSFPLLANGVVASEQLIAEQPDLVRGFVQATLKGLRDTLDNPDEAFTLSLEQIPEANISDGQLQRQVLQESLPYWYSDLTESEGLGYSDPAAWAQTEEFMRETTLLSGPVDVAAAFTNEFIK
jgi:NitT/TauT family transport system substrate-binding protein